MKRKFLFLLIVAIAILTIASYIELHHWLAISYLKIAKNIEAFFKSKSQ